MNEKEKRISEASVFPLYIPRHDGDEVYFGITRREHFAGLAMQGMLTSGATCEDGHHSYHPDDIARLAVYAADALIAELSQKRRNSHDKRKE